MMVLRAEHLTYAEEKVITVHAGPRLTEMDDPKPRGSMLIVEVESRGQAEEFAANDPYNKAGLFEKITIHRWMGALGPWLPRQG